LLQLAQDLFNALNFPIGDGRGLSFTASFFAPFFRRLQKSRLCLPCLLLDMGSEIEELWKFS